MNRERFENLLALDLDGELDAAGRAELDRLCTTYAPFDRERTLDRRNMGLLRERGGALAPPALAEAVLATLAAEGAAAAAGEAARRRVEAQAQARPPHQRPVTRPAPRDPAPSFWTSIFGSPGVRLAFAAAATAVVGWQAWVVFGPGRAGDDPGVRVAATASPPDPSSERRETEVAALAIEDAPEPAPAPAVVSPPAAAPPLRAKDSDDEHLRIMAETLRESSGDAELAVTRPRAIEVASAAPDPVSPSVEEPSAERPTADAAPAPPPAPAVASAGAPPPVKVGSPKTLAKVERDPAPANADSARDAFASTVARTESPAAASEAPPAVPTLAAPPPPTAPAVVPPTSAPAPPEDSPEAVRMSIEIAQAAPVGTTAGAGPVRLRPAEARAFAGAEASASRDMLREIELKIVEVGGDILAKTDDPGAPGTKRLRLRMTPRQLRAFERELAVLGVLPPGRASGGASSYAFEGRGLDAATPDRPVVVDLRVAVRP